MVHLCPVIVTKAVEEIAFLDASAKPKWQKDQPTGDQEKQIGGNQ